MVGAEEVVTVRVFLRCDCCTDRIEGITVWAQDAQSGDWQQCGEPLGTTSADKSVGENGRDMSKCDVSRAPEDQFLERDCGGLKSTAVKVVKQGATIFNLPEIEVYPC